MSKGSLIKSTAIVTVIAMLSKFIGMFRDILISNNFGATAYNDAYKISAAIPDMIFMVIGLAISTSFLPTLSRIRVNDGIDEMHKFANNIINILFIISLIIFGVSSLFPEKIVYLLAKNATTETISIAVSLTRIILVNLIFLSVNACFTTLLQVHEDFVIPSILGLFFNLPMIIYLLLFKDYNIYGLTIANVIGNFFRIIVQIPSLRKHGFRYKFFINIRDERVRRILILIIPVVIGAGANSLNLVVDKSIATGLGEGQVTNLDIAQLFVSFINSMVTTSITAVIYPVLANRLSEGKHKEFTNILSKTIIYLAIVLIPITAGMIIYGGDALRVVFVHGNYTEYAASFATLALLGYTIGIFFTGLRDLLNSTLFSMGYTKITAKNGCIGVFINIVLSISLSKRYGIVGISIAASIAMMVTSILLLINIVKLEGKLDLKDLLSKISKVIIATLAMVCILIVINLIFVNINNILSIIIGGTVGIISYFVAINIFKLEEVSEILSLLKLKKFVRSKL